MEFPTINDYIACEEATLVVVSHEDEHMYSVSHLIQTPGDYGNFFLLKGVLIKVIQNRGHFDNKSH